MHTVPPKSVLIIDDNRDAADTLAILLGQSQHKVLVAYDGREGLQLARETVPDVILLDLSMPHINGYKVANELRNDQAFAKTVLVALTGFADAEHAKKSLSCGFDLHFAKPIDSFHLRAALKYTRKPPSQDSQFWQSA
jgi:CheY-like chemotaxis protein